MGICYTKIKIQQLTIPSGNGYTSFISVTARNLILQLQCIFQIAINRTAVASISVNMAIVARILFNITILVRIAVNKGYVHNSCKLYSTVIVVAVNITVEVMVALNIIE